MFYWQFLSNVGKGEGGRYIISRTEGCGTDGVYDSYEDYPKLNVKELMPSNTHKKVYIWLTKVKVRTLNDKYQKPEKHTV